MWMQFRKNKNASVADDLAGKLRNGLFLESKQDPNREEKLCGVAVQILVFIIPF